MNLILLTSVKPHAKIALLLSLVSVSSLFAQNIDIDNVKRDINNIVISNNIDPILPSVADIENHKLFDKTNKDIEQYYSGEYLLGLFYIYSAYGKYVKFNTSTFVYFHNKILNYSSELFEYRINDSTTDKEKVLSGLTKMLSGSITIMSDRETFTIEQRHEISLNTRLLVAKWWENLTTPMQSEIFISVTRSLDGENDPQMVDDLTYIKNMYKF